MSGTGTREFSIVRINFLLELNLLNQICLLANPRRLRHFLDIRYVKLRGITRLI